MPNHTNRNVLIVVGCLLALMVLCCCLALTSMTAVIALGASQAGDLPGLDFLLEGTETPTPVVIRPTVVPQATAESEDAGEQSSAAQPLPAQTPSPAGMQATLKTLQEIIVPTSDLRDLAQRLEGKDEIPLTLPLAEKVPQQGDRQKFWTTNMDTDENTQIEATLRYVGDNLYFWVDSRVKPNQAELNKLAKDFDESVYDLNREFFGEEFKPGIDGDPRLYVLMARGLGSTIAGYFSSVDSYSAEAHEYSNQHEMIFLNADNIDLAEEFTYGVLAHEFQHMIHWHQDRNEETWLNEGFSELAAFLNGFGAGGFEYAFINSPDMQLTYWPGGDADTSRHYGAAFMFTNYFLGRFGERATQAIVGNKANGMVSVDGVLESIDAREEDGTLITADDVFTDWAVANYLNKESVADGRYAYKEYPDAPSAGDTEEVETCPTGMETRDVHQYGTDYVRISCRGDYLLRFEGSTEVKILPTDARSGLFAFWSNRGDDSNMRLTQTFDFSNVDTPLTMTFSTWYDLEENYDYLYILASEDGQDWEIVKTPSGTDEDPSGNSYGWGYNGKSGEDGSWIVEEVDLSAFAGRKVQIRFEYVTDAAVNGEGFFLDDIRIPAIDYVSDFEADDGGWQAEGFVRVENVLPQTFRISLIEEGEQTNVKTLQVDEQNSLEIPLKLGGDIKDAVLVISGTTRFTNQKAAYRYEILKAE